MQNDLPLPERRSIRLPDFDYTTPGVYAFTIVTLGRTNLFGAIVEGEMHIHTAGEIAQQEWLHSVEMRREITLDEFVTMPNHIHGIVWIEHLGERLDGKPMAAQTPAGGRLSTPR